MRKYVFSALLVIGVAACGDEAATPAGDAGEHHDSSPTDAGAQEGDADAPVACVPEIPVRPTSISVTGESTGMVAKVLDADYDPPRRYSNNWTLELRDASGMPVQNAMFSNVRTWMPVHAHNGKFVPTIEAVPASPGSYTFDGVHFTMTGPWQLQFQVTANGASERFVLDICVGD